MCKIILFDSGNKYIFEFDVNNPPEWIVRAGILPNLNQGVQYNHEYSSDRNRQERGDLDRASINSLVQNISIRNSGG